MDSKTTTPPRHALAHVLIPGDAEHDDESEVQLFATEDEARSAIASSPASPRTE